jgi:hypothetical protein
VGRAPRHRRKPVVVDGLWGVGFGALAGPTNVLYFASGPGNETEGLFGSISFTP